MILIMARSSNSRIRNTAIYGGAPNSLSGIGLTQQQEHLLLLSLGLELEVIATQLDAMLIHDVDVVSTSLGSDSRIDAECI